MATGTPYDSEAKKRKFDEFFSPENKQSFVDMLKAALVDPAVVTMLRGVISEAADKSTAKLEKRIECLESKVDDLERKLEERDQRGRRDCLKIGGIAETEGENTDKIVIAVGKEIGVDVAPGDISNSHRLPSWSSAKTCHDIVVRFVSFRKRCEFFGKRLNLKKSKTFKNVFVNDHLTPQRQKILYECRQAKKRKELMDAWSYDGKIFIKVSSRNGGEKNCRVNSLKDLYPYVPSLRPQDTMELNKSGLSFEQALEELDTSY